MAGRIDARLAELGIVLPAPLRPVANYVPYVIAGDQVVISGQIPMLDGRLTCAGRLGEAVSLGDGIAACRLCFINLVAQLHAACAGDLDRVAQVVRLGGFIAATPAFADHAKVMNGASDLAVAVFGEAGRHARSTVGVASLPLGCAVEVEGLFRIA